MPEVPSNMQEGLAHLELEAREVSPHREQTHDQGYDRRRQDSISTISSLTPYADQQPSSSFPPQGAGQQAIHVDQGPRGYTASYEHTNASAYQNAFSNGNASGSAARSLSSTQSHPLPLPPKPTDFPKLRDAGLNVPPSDEEKEEVLERARTLVLNSNDPEMQLAWAQDALSWVDTAVGSRQRIEGNGALQSPTPKIEHQLRVDAISIINFLAEQQHPKAVFLKGTWHEFGKFGYPPDKRESILLYRISAEKGYARAEYRIGTQYEGMQDMARAIKHYVRGVQAGDSASSYRLGMMTLLGQHGQQQDFRKGIEQIRFAANTADENAPQGAYVYGMLLSRELPNISIPDLFLPVDIDQAKQFIEKAAYLGFAKAQQKMGEAYELCLLGCDFNPALSLHYNALAARQGDSAADMAISKWFLCGYEGVFAKNEELAFTYAQRSAAGGLPTAEFALGYFYEIGMYVKRDIEAAKAWYSKAADHGNKDAIMRLQSISQQKVLNKRDHEQTAINRIRSQYGSKRGARPDRFKEKPSPMAPMSEEMADERTITPIPEPNHQQPRRISTARPLSVAPYPDERPKSVAPYPVDDFPAQQGSRTSSLRPLSGPIADRPSSAFGIRPLNLAPSPAQQGRGGPMRPSSSLGNMTVPPQDRSAEAGNRQRVASVGYPPQMAGYRQTSPNRVASGHQPPTAGQMPTIDDRHDGRARLQKAAPEQQRQSQPSHHRPQQLPTIPDLRHPSTSSTYSQPPSDSYSAKPLPQIAQVRPAGLPPNPAAARQGRGSPSGQYDARSHLPSQGGTPRPDRAESAQSRASVASHDSIQSMPSRVASATPNSGNRSSTAASTASSSVKPMKEGPKTFDEMGIPVQKNDSECVSTFDFLLYNKRRLTVIIDCDVTYSFYCIEENTWWLLHHESLTAITGL